MKMVRRSKRLSSGARSFPRKKPKTVPKKDAQKYLYRQAAAHFSAPLSLISNHELLSYEYVRDAVCTASVMNQFFQYSGS